MPFHKTLDGVRLHYFDSNTSGPVVFLQHGFSTNLENVLELTPQRGIRLIAVDLRGHGLSETGLPELCTISQACIDIKHLCYELDIVPKIVGGISLGAAIALRLAKETSCDHLILARPAMFDRPAPRNFEIFGYILEITTTQPKLAWSGSLKALPAFQALKHKTPEMMETYLRFLEHPRMHDIHYWMHNLASDWHELSIEDMKNIPIPTTVIAQRYDQLHPYAFAEALAQTLPKTNLIELSPRPLESEVYRMDFRNALQTIFATIN